METPSSTTRRVTRSQTLAAMNHGSGSNVPFSKKMEDSENCRSKSRQRTASKQQQDRSALIDITNDSPIVGVAMQTPSSAMSNKKKNSRIKGTPGSGEALLRGQVKTLLQKVEEEAELTKIPVETRPFIHLVNSPVGLLAPTPANTPQIPNPSGEGLDIVIASPVFEENLRISEVVTEETEKSCEAQKSLSITRSLLLDFSDKSDLWDYSSECSSVVTNKGESDSKEKSSFSQDEDDSSVWSMQVNASARGEEDEEVEVSSYMGGEEEEEEEEEEGNEEFLDGLCEGMRNMSVKEKTMAEFEGKHIRFVYDSEDEEIVEEKEAKQSQSPRMMRLKGLPTPKGKHSRFDAEEEEYDVVPEN